MLEHVRWIKRYGVDDTYFFGLMIAELPIGSVGYRLQSKDIQDFESGDWRVQVTVLCEAQSLLESQADDLRELVGVLPDCVLVQKLKQTLADIESLAESDWQKAKPILRDAWQRSQV